MLPVEGSVLWPLVDSFPATRRSERNMMRPLLVELSRLPIPTLARFQREFLDCMDELLSWRLWEAADLIHGLPCSGDTFVDFRSWLVVQGSRACREALQDPDSLAAVPEIARITRLPRPWADADYPQFTSLGSLAGDAFEGILAKLGPAAAESLERPDVLDEQTVAYPKEPSPADYGVDSAVHLRLPSLSALRGSSY